MTAEKIFYPVCLGYPDKERDAKAKAFYEKVHELEAAAERTTTEWGDFYSYVTYYMPDGTVWQQMIENDYLIPYSLEKIEEPTGSGTAGEREQQ